MNISKKNQRIISPLLIIFFVLLVDNGMGKLLQPVSYADYFRHDIEQIEKNKEEVDIVFIGASRTYRTFVPQIFEDELGLNCVVNAGSSSLRLEGAYYQLKDLIERIHPKEVFFCVTFDMLYRSTDTQAKLIIYDRLSPLNKLLMAINEFKNNERYLLFTYRFKDNFNIETITNNYRTKKQLVADNYVSYSEKGEYYADTGFVYSHNSCQTGMIKLLRYPKFEIKEGYIKYLDDCIDLCEKNGIRVTFASGVTSLMRMYSLNGYQDAVDFFNDYAKKRGTVYYNLNYLKAREDFIPEELMHDHNHLNGEGAQIVSEKFAKILDEARDGKDVSKYFYSDLAELKKDVHRIVTVAAKISKDENDPKKMHASIVSYQNDDVETIYKLSICYDNEDTYTTIMDWSTNTEVDFIVNQEEGFKICVEAAATDETIGHAKQIYKY